MRRRGSNTCEIKFSVETNMTTREPVAIRASRHLVFESNSIALYFVYAHNIQLFECRTPVPSYHFIYLYIFSYSTLNPVLGPSVSHLATAFGPAFATRGSGAVPQGRILLNARGPFRSGPGG